MPPTLDNSELEALLQRCVARDQAALARLYETVGSPLMAVLMRMLRNRAVAEDALQDVFLRIWEQASQFDERRGRAMAWMVSIARNRAIDLQRATRVTLLLDSAEVAAAEQLQVEPEHAEFSALQRSLQRCLEMLAAAQRQCLLLAYQHGLTVERISQSLGQPLGSVKSRVRRGLQSLRGCMGSEPGAQQQ